MAFILYNVFFFFFFFFFLSRLCVLADCKINDISSLGHKRCIYLLMHNHNADEYIYIYIYARTDLSLVLFCSLSFALARAAWHFRNLKTAIILYVVNNVWIWIKWIQNWNNILLCCNKRGFFFFFSLSLASVTPLYVYDGEAKKKSIKSLV